LVNVGVIPRLRGRAAFHIISALILSELPPVHVSIVVRYHFEPVVVEELSGRPALLRVPGHALGQKVGQAPGLEVPEPESLYELIIQRLVVGDRREILNGAVRIHMFV